MYSEESEVVKANNNTAFNYFKKAADKVCEDSFFAIKLLWFY